VDIYKPLNDPNLPPTGEKQTPTSPPAGKIPQSLEESPRHRPSQRPKSSTHWKNLDAHRANSGKIVPVDGRIRTFTRSLAGRIIPVDGRIETWTVLSRTWVEFTRIAAIKKAYRVLRALSVSLIGG
jgi:hypothetical protein